ncbi:MAG: PAS domain-containing protein [Prosthecobacter sp.]
MFEFGGPETEDMDLVLGVLVENAPVAMAMFDRAMRYMLANRQWIAEFGLQQVQPLVGKSQYEIFPGLHPGWRQVYERALQGHIVRSEHDALSGPDGRAWIYRWEVRPWRKKRDASVGGLMVTCEKFSPAKGVEESASPHGSTTDAAPLSAADPVAVPPDCMLPIVVVNEHGVILRANVAAARLTLERGMQEGMTCFWDVFGGKRDFTALRQLTLETLAHATALEEAEPVCINIVSDLVLDTAMPTRWLVSPVRQKHGAEGTPRQFMLMAQPCPPPEAHAAPAILSAPMAPPAQVPMAPPPAEMAAVDEATLQRMEEELLRTRQEHRMLSEAQHAFAQRETRMRSYLEAIPCGVFVLDERGAALYQNERLTRLLGRPIEKDQTVEDWLAHGCPTPEHREQVALVWRESVWRRQLMRTISLATADGLLKDLEFNPVSLPGGGLLVSIQDVTEHTRHDEQLRSMEAKLRTLLMGSPVAVVLTDKGGVIFEVNQQAETLLGQAKSELRRYPLDAWLEPASATARRDALRHLKSSGRQAEALGVRVKRTDGTLINAVLNLAPVTDSLGEVHCTVHYLQEVVPAHPPAPAFMPAQGVLDGATAAHGEPARAVVMTTSTETSAELLLTTDAYGRVRTWTDQARQIFDVEAATAVGRPLHQFFRPSDATGFFADLAQQAELPGQFVEHSYFGGNGRRGHVPVSARMLEDGGFELTAQIVTRMEVPAEGDALTQAPPPPAGRATVPLAFQVVSTSSQRWPGVDLEREKLLLTETHHRIKNHLQIISSLLNMQINGVADQDARNALRSSQNRVRAIAALHQHLYQIALGKGDTFSDFTRELVLHLRECYETTAEQVTVRLEIQEGPVQPEWLMPLALTLNEALSNCFEHAFPHGRRGQITATLACVQSSGELTVTDDGIGLAGDFRPDEGPGLGLKILAVFAEQMRGQLFVQGTADAGTEIKLRFPLVSAEG